MLNKKSDVKAKAAFVKVLEERGFQAKVVSKPADIVATKDGQTWYFEIKMTKQKEAYFGAATLTEWEQAMADPSHFRFVVAKTDETESEFEFLEYTPEEFMAFSTIPPFKIFFNINFGDTTSRKGTGRKSNRLTPENLEIMRRCFEEIRLTNE